MAMFSTYDRIMNCVRSSNLNFACQETPYSLYLTIRKSKVKNDNKQSSSPVIGNYEVESLVKENLSLRERLRNLENKLDAFEDTNKMLEEKLASAEGKVLKAYKENLKNEDEMKNLRNVIKDNNNDISKLKCEKKEVMKEMKKKVHDLDKSNLAHKNSIESLKEDVKKQKDEKSRLEKETKQLEKKIKSGKHENEIDSNRNIPPDFPPQSCSSGTASSSTRPPCTPTRGSHPFTSTSPPTTSTRVPPSTSPSPVESKLSCSPPSPHTPPGQPPPRTSSYTTMEEMKAAIREAFRK